MKTRNIVPPRRAIKMPFFVTWLIVVLSACEQPAGSPELPQPAKAVVSDAVLAGVAGSTIDPYEITVTFSGQELLMPIAIDADLSEWITNMPYGLSANSKELVASKSHSVKIEVSGTPLETTSEVLALTIPEGVLTQYKALPVDSNPNTRFDITNADATVSEGTVIGMVNEEIIPSRFAISLFADTLGAPISQDEDLSAWFPNIPSGLSAKAAGAADSGDQKVNVVISGTPGEVKEDDPINIEIPANALSAAKSITVYPNHYTRYAIYDASSRFASVGNVTVSGTWKFSLRVGLAEDQYLWSRNNPVAENNILITLHNDTFNSLGTNTSANWIRNLPGGLSTKIVTAGPSSVTLQVTGVPESKTEKTSYSSLIPASNELLQINIPASALSSGTATMVVPNALAKIYITDAFANLPKYGEGTSGRIFGVVGSPVVEKEINITLTEDTLKDSIIDSFSQPQSVDWIKNLPRGLSQELTAINTDIPAQTVMTVKISGTPTEAPVVTSYSNYLYMKITLPGEILNTGVDVEVFPEFSAFYAIRETALTLKEVSDMVDIQGGTVTETPGWEFSGGSDLHNPDDYSREPKPFYGQTTYYRGNVWINPLPLTIPSFKAGKYPVTEALWWAVYNWAINDSGLGYQWGYYSWPGTSDNQPVPEKEYCPMYNINIPECIVWCNARSEKESKTPVYYSDAEFTTVLRTKPEKLNDFYTKEDADGYRVPTRAQLEYAMRGGINSPQWDYRYPGVQADGAPGGKIDDTAPYMWVDPIRVYDAAFCETTVGLFKPTWAGLYDVGGQLAEKTITPDSWDLSQFSHGGYAWNRDPSRQRFDVADKPRTFIHSSDIEGVRVISDVKY